MLLLYFSLYYAFRLKREYSKNLKYFETHLLIVLQCQKLWLNYKIHNKTPQKHNNNNDNDNNINIDNNMNDSVIIQNNKMNNNHSNNDDWEFHSELIEITINALQNLMHQMRHNDAIFYILGMQITEGNVSKLISIWVIGRIIGFLVFN